MNGYTCPGCGWLLASGRHGDGCRELLATIMVTRTRIANALFTLLAVALVGGMFTLLYLAAWVQGG